MTAVALVAAAVSGGCARHAAKIPLKASTDLSCPPGELQIFDLGSGDTGPHYVLGCGKKATYEMNPLGEWVLNGPIVADPQYVKPQ
jgi:hypothetical protein